MTEKMYRIVLLLAVLFFVQPLCGAQEKQPSRTVTVCALRDTAKQNEGVPSVTAERIRQLVADAAREYENNVSITFAIEEIRESTFDITNPREHLDDYRAACSGGDIVMVFTNQMRIVSEGRDLYFHLGDSNLAWGVLLLYETDAIRERSAPPGYVLLHELGHLFGAEEKDMPDGIFWTEEFKAIVRANKNRTWKPSTGSKRP